MLPRNSSMNLPLIPLSLSSVVLSLLLALLGLPKLIPSDRLDVLDILFTCFLLTVPPGKKPPIEELNELSEVNRNALGGIIEGSEHSVEGEES